MFQVYVYVMHVVTLFGPTPASLVLSLMTAYSKIFQKYLKDIPFVSLTKSLKIP
jgi:hypothetical protein